MINLATCTIEEQHAIWHHFRPMFGTRRVGYKDLCPTILELSTPCMQAMNIKNPNG